MANFYKRIRQFCDLHVRHVSRATGISESAITMIEKGRRQPNHIEQKLIESFLRDRLPIVFDSEGPIPEWVRGLGVTMLAEDDSKRAQEGADG